MTSSHHLQVVPREQSVTLVDSCRGGERRSPLPDFYIGAHAAVLGYRLLTRDEKRYRTSFPTLRLICPE